MFLLIFTMRCYGNVGTGYCPVSITSQSSTKMAKYIELVFGMRLSSTCRTMYYKEIRESKGLWNHWLGLSVCLFVCYHDN